MKLKKKTAVVLGVLLAISSALPAYAMNFNRQVISAEWVDENKGPGVAYWVDENGNRAEPPTDPSSEGVSEESPIQVPAEGEQSTEVSPAEEQPAEEQPAEVAAESIPAEETAAQGRVIDPARPMVALTFDDGPYAPVGNRIMDCLAQYGGKATFFVVGNRCATYKTEMQRMAAEGHEIGNHTQDHKYLNKLGAAAIVDQIDRGVASIQAASGVTPALVRLPGGNKNATVLANVHYPMIMWSIDTLDWKTRNAANTVNVVLSNVKDGDIVLMHELYQASGDAAVQIIPALVNAGYQLVTVSELAQYRGGVAAGGVYSRFRP